MSIAQPGKATFAFKNVGHVLHDFTIDRKSTGLIQPGKTASVTVTFKKKGLVPLCTVLRTRRCRNEGHLTVR
jgi:uncharacterized cupredoxin-like copper-binding protein